MHKRAVAGVGSLQQAVAGSVVIRVSSIEHITPVGAATRLPGVSAQLWGEHLCYPAAWFEEGRSREDDYTASASRWCDRHAATVAGVVAPTVVAQESVSSTVTVGGDASGVDDGETVLQAPGVTISGGVVSYGTAIGVISDGGSSVGATTGGDTDASITK